MPISHPPPSSSSDNASVAPGMPSSPPLSSPPPTRQRRNTQLHHQQLPQQQVVHHDPSTNNNDNNNPRLFSQSDVDALTARHLLQVKALSDELRALKASGGLKPGGGGGGGGGAGENKAAGGAGGAAAGALTNVRGVLALSQVANFNPTMLLRVVAEGDTLSASSCRRHQGSVLAFFDISGYTKLAESLARKEGSAGTEKLSASLSVFFEKAIQIINSHGGDVVKFCGDALMCVFPSEGELLYPAKAEQDDHNASSSSSNSAADHPHQSFPRPAHVDLRSGHGGDFRSGHGGDLRSGHGGDLRALRRGSVSGVIGPPGLRASSAASALLPDRAMAASPSSPSLSLLLQPRPSAAAAGKRTSTGAEDLKRRSEATGRCRYAMQCALEAMRTLSGYKISSEVTLDLKIMIGFGDIYSHVVCGVGSERVEFLVSGDPLKQITEGEHLASPGKIIISAEAFELCCDNVAVKESALETEHELSSIRTTSRGGVSSTSSSAQQQQQQQPVAEPYNLLPMTKLLLGGSQRSPTNKQQPAAALGAHSPRPNPQPGYEARGLTPLSRFVELVGMAGLVLPLRSELPINFQPGHLIVLQKALEPKTFDALSELSSTWTRNKQLEMGLDHRLSKHSTATIVFITPKRGCDYLNADPIKSHLALQSLFLTTNSHSKHYAGFFRQFVLDDKGLVAILAFEGQEKSCVHACQCSLAIRDDLNRQGIEVSMGIATGKVFCGPVGCVARAELCFVGDSVNLAARLMGAADSNVILAEQETFNMARAGIDMTKRQQLKVKGKDSVIQTYAVEKAKALSRNQRSDGSGSVINLRKPNDFLTHVGSYVTATQLDYALAIAASMSYAPTGVTGGSRVYEASSSELPSKTGSDNSSVLQQSNEETMSALAAKLRGTGEDAAVLVLVFDDPSHFQSALQVPTLPNSPRVIAQAHGGDIILSSQIDLNLFSITVLFPSNTGESLICTRESSKRTRDQLATDACRCLTQLLNVKCFGLAIGPVATFPTGHIWITYGDAIVDAKIAAERAINDELAVVAAPTCAEHIAGLKMFDWKPCEDSFLEVRQLPAAAALDALLNMTAAAYSQRLYIVLRRKRAADVQRINAILKGDLPSVVAARLDEFTDLNTSVSVVTSDCFLLRVELRFKLLRLLPQQAHQISTVVDTISKFIQPVGGYLLRQDEMTSQDSLSLFVAVAAKLEIACFVASLLCSGDLIDKKIVSVRAVVTAPLCESTFNAANQIQFLPYSPVNAGLADLAQDESAAYCHSSALRDPETAAVVKLTSSLLYLTSLLEDEDAHEASSDDIYKIGRYVEDIQREWSKDSSREKIFSREKERAFLRDALDTFVLGINRQVVLVQGSAGQGKSVLISEVHDVAASLASVTVVRSGASDIDGSNILSMWRPIFASLMWTANVDQHGFFEHIRYYRPDLLPIISLLNEVLPYDMQLLSCEQTENLSSTAIRSSTQILCVMALALLFEKIGPVVLIIEDLHWATSVSLRLLIDVVKLNSALVIASSRPVIEEDHLWQDFEDVRLSATKVILLNSFSDSEIRDFAASYLGGTRDDAAYMESDFVQLARRKTQGLPFLLCALLREVDLVGVSAFVASEVLKSSAIKNSAYDIELQPSNVNNRRDSGIDRRRSSTNALKLLSKAFISLSPATFKTLAIVSIHGGRITSAGVLQIHRNLSGQSGSCAIGDVESSLSQLQAQRLVAKEGSSHWFAFHKIVEDSVIEITADKDFRSIHLAVAEFLLRSEDDELTSSSISRQVRDPGRIAHHLLSGDDGPKARSYLIAAGRKAHREGALVEVVTFLKEAFCIPHSAQKLSKNERWEEGHHTSLLGEAYYSLGMYGIAVPHLMAALRYLDAQPSSSKLLQKIVAARFIVGATVKSRLKAVQVDKSLVTVVSPDNATSMTAARVQRDICVAYRCLVEIFMIMPEVYSKHYVISGILSMKAAATRSNSVGHLGLSHAWLAVTLYSLGNISAAKVNVELAADLATRNPGVDLCLASSSFANCFYAASCGDFEGAVEGAQNSVEFFSKCGDFKRARECAAIEW